MAIPLEPVNLQDLSQIQVRFFRGPSRRVEERDVLVIKYAGQYRPGGAGNPDAQFMYAMGQAGVKAWQPDGAILDFSELEYVWGNGLDLVFMIGEKEFGFASLPLALVVGPSCEPAVRTLLRGLMVKSPLAMDDWVFRDLDSAWDYIDGEVAAFWDRCRGNNRAVT